MKLENNTTFINLVYKACAFLTWKQKREKIF